MSCANPYLKVFEPDYLADPERPLTVKEVSRVLRVNPSWCYNDKSLPWVKIGKYRKIYAKDLSAYIEEIRRIAKQNVMRHSRAQQMVEKLEVMD